MKKFIFMLLVFWLAASFAAYSQVNDSTDKQDSARKQLYLVTKTDNAEFYGYILSDDGREILLETKTIGKIYIAKSDIKLIKEISEEDVKNTSNLKYTDYRAKGPFTTRYYFTNNALRIEKNENYAMVNIYGPEVHFAVQDNLSIGVMASWVASPIALASKYSVYSKGNTNLSIGTIVASSGYLLNAKGYGGLHWLTATQGNRLQSVSVSLGYGYADLSDLVEVGERYYINTGDYNVDFALQQKLYGSEYPRDEDHYMYKGFSDSYIIGLSGITPVGKKASFIFDAMAVMGKTKDVEYTNKLTTVTYMDKGIYVTKAYNVGIGSVVETGNQTTLILMPAMRFNTAYNKAFQVALAGIINIQGSDVTSFPIPTVGWLRQF